MSYDKDMNIYRSLLKLFESKKQNISDRFARRQFNELVRRNLTIPVKMYHL